MGKQEFDDAYYEDWDDDDQRRRPTKGEMIITAEGGEEEIPIVYELGEHEFARTRRGMRVVSTAILTLLWLRLAWSFVYPNLYLSLAGSIGFEMLPQAYDTLLWILKNPIGVAASAIILWFFGPEFLIIPPDIRLVTKLFGRKGLTRGDWGFTLILKPFEWPYRVTDARALTADFVDINTTTAGGIPVNLNATLLFRLIRPAATVFQIQNIKQALSTVLEPILIDVAGEKGYEFLISKKGDLSKDLLIRARKELKDLKTIEEIDYGARLARFELKDTPISDKVVARYYAAPIEDEQRGEGRGHIQKADVEYLTGIADDLMKDDSDLTRKEALNIALEMRRYEAIEQTRANVILGEGITERSTRGQRTESSNPRREK